MKLWIDDIRPAPDGYEWCQSVGEAKEEILLSERLAKSYWEMYEFIKKSFPATGAPDKWKEQAKEKTIELIDIDHDAGDYASEGGDYIKLLDWLEETGRNYPIRIHSMNPVGAENMRRIIQRNGWTEVE